MFYGAWIPQQLQDVVPSGNGSQAGTDYSFSFVGRVDDWPTICGWISSDPKLRSQPWSRSQTKNSKHPGMSKHVVRKLYVRPDSSLWHNRNNSVLLGSCESKQGQGGKLGRGGMWKIPWIQLPSWGNNITWSSWGIKIRHPLYDQSAEQANNTPPSMANMLNRVITSTLSLWGNKIRPPYDQYAERANNINFIFMWDQNSPPQNNMLIGEITSTWS